MATDDLPALPSRARLHERHHGLTDVVAGYFAEAAAVCMQRHHTSPKMVSVTADTMTPRDYVAAWDVPSDRQIVAWANRDDATRDGAYGIVIAAAEAHLGLFVIGRAPPRSGSDYLLASQPYNQEIDDWRGLNGLEILRLEVSGIDQCDGEARLEARVREKVAQLRRGRSVLPGIVVLLQKVVRGFKGYRRGGYPLARDRGRCRVRPSASELSKGVAMSVKLHRQAEKLMGEADLLEIQGLPQEAKARWFEAAQTEAEAFAQIPRDLGKTRGIIAVSTVVLYRRAGALDDAIRIGQQYLDTAGLPEGWRSDLRVLVKEICQERASPADGQVPVVDGPQSSLITKLGLTQLVTSWRKRFGRVDEDSPQAAS